MEKFKSKITLYPESFDTGTTFDEIEIHPCHVIGKDKDGKEIVEQCEYEQAEFWSLYLHIPESGLCCIADCDTDDTAQHLRDFLMLAGHLLICED